MNDYNASSIRVLNLAERAERFAWERARVLHETHPWVPLTVIERLLEAAQLSSTDEQLVIKRYLDGDRSTILPAEFGETYKELADQRPR